ncbi:hypothetical protein [Chondrinema litorale]|uniref:hypothetical protein n=1 Tax=Chondrinema litorale TaxID=2994555 RepID=UPI0025437809|nr:hypothetical protein [Chondrinema litorale]UZR93161.1 hypothetical protein OQ292_14975 [Chondrinema litorale]
MTLKQLLNPLYTDISTKSSAEGKSYIVVKKTEGKAYDLLSEVHKAFAQCEFVEKTKEVMDLQELYFETKDPQTLKACKQAERELRLMIKKIQKLIK